MAKLQGIHAVVTRPAHQAQDLCDLIEKEGGQAIRFPVLDIVPKIDAEFLHLIEHLSDYHMAIFISRNAVDLALPAINSRGGLPKHLRIGAVGNATANALAKWNCPVNLCPRDTFDSESLLALPELKAVQGKNIVIFRGVGGREHLAESLRGRGAVVHYGQCYERRKPEGNSRVLLEHWAQHSVDIIIITSIEGLMNLVEMVGKEAHEYLFNTPLLVVSERMAQEARRLGFSAPIICAAKAADEQMVDALCHWAQQRGRSH